MKTQEGYYPAFVERVIDGDTLVAIVEIGFDVIRRIKIRVARIDCSEMNAKDPAEKAKAEQGKRFAIQAVLGKYIKIKLEQPKPDAWDRYICEVEYNGLNLSDQLLANNLATLYKK